MSRSVRFEVPVDTSLFTPLQLQPRAVFGLGMSGWARWLREHWVAFPRLIRDQGLGVVIAGMELEYFEPFGFVDADALETNVAVTVRADGALVFLVARFVSPCTGAEVARVSGVLRPVRIGEGLTLAAHPANLRADIVANFGEDEVVRTGSRVRLRTLASELEAAEPPIAGACRAFTVHRHLCETADQWSGIALPDVTTDVREGLVSERSDDVPALAAAFVHPMRRLAIEFRRPAFFLDPLTVDCSAYVRDEELIFVHRFSSAVDNEALAMCMEWFAAGSDPLPSGSVQHLDGGGVT